MRFLSSTGTTNKRHLFIMKDLHRFFFFCNQQPKVYLKRVNSVTNGLKGYGDLVFRFDEQYFYNLIVNSNFSGVSGILPERREWTILITTTYTQRRWATVPDTAVLS